MSDCSNWRGEPNKATVEREFEERRSGDSGAWSVSGRQPERIQRVNAETTERVDVPRTRRVRTYLSYLFNKLTKSSRANPVRFLPSYELCYTGAETREGSRNAAAIMSSPTGSPFCGYHPVARGTPPGTSSSAAGHEGGPGKAILCPRPEPAGGPRAVPSWMDREVRARGGIPTAPAPPTHMPVQKMGPQDDPEAFLDLFEKTAEACGWPQTDWPVRLIPLLTREAQLAAQQLPVQNLLVYDDLKRAILQRVGRSPEQHRQRFPIAGAGGERPALRDGSPAPGRLLQMAVGRGRLRRADHRPCGCWNDSLRGFPRRPRSGSSATARRRWTWPSNSPRTRWWRATGLANPTVRLSLSPLPFFFSHYLPA